MTIDRRGVLGLLGGAVAAPGLLWSSPAVAATKRIVRRGAPISLVTANTIDQPDIAVCGLKNGRFAAAWCSTTGTLQTRVYGPDGKPVAAIDQLTTSAAPGVDLAANPDGTYALFATQTRGINPEDLHYQPLSATGVKLHAPYRINTHVDRRADRCCAARLTNGNFAVAYRSAAADYDADIAYVVVSPAGAIVHRVGLLYRTSETEHPINVVGLAGGGFVVAVRVQSTPTSSVLFKLLAFDAAGKRVGAPINLVTRPNWGGVTMRVGLTAMANGGFAAFWREDGATFTIARLRGRFFDATRTAVKSINVALPLTNTSGNESSVALEYAPGKVLVAVESGLNSISAAAFDVSGAVVAAVTKVAGLPNDPFRDDRSGPGLVQISANRFMLTFSENSPTSSNFLLGKAQILDLV